MEKEQLARFLALQNAIKFNGTANPKALIGALVAEYPQSKQDMKGLMTLINNVVVQVNELSLDEQKIEIEKIKPDYFSEQQAAREKRKEDRSELPPLKEAEDGKVITRIPPEPSKYNHLGHALSFLINYLYAQKYNGKCILRFEDTNPEKSSQEFVDAMREDIGDYLGITADAELFVSDDMDKFYTAASELVKRNLAYVCSCASADMSLMRREMKECVHRNESEQQQKWQQMKEGALTGSVLRLKVDMTHKNAVMRDPVIMRVVGSPHYRQGEKYKSWPMYDFENALEDSWCGVTHVLRSNEFQDRIELHNHIKELLGLQKQVVQQYGRFNIIGSTTQGREIREMIEQNKVIGWDDPRLITLKALKRRGIVREAFYELAKQCGMSKTQTNLDFSVIAAINRQILDEKANRYFFVHDPVKITVENWPADLCEVELKLHPHKNRGGRKLMLNNEFYISQHDYDALLSGKLFRFIDTCNLQYQDGKFVFVSQSIDDYRNAQEDKYGLIHFLPVEQSKPAKVFMPDATYQEGMFEATAQVKVGDVVQLERYGFARVDSINPLVFWYAHD